ncbi:MAG: hypothetical protein IKQ56_05730 [Lachnospiraceae bacterium]|nr:hypothetical protein [Lachnospiraceae bacterium]
MTFDEFKKKIADYPFTETENEVLDNFEDALKVINEKQFDESEKVLNEFSEYMNSFSYICEKPESFVTDESKAQWEKERNKLEGFHDFLMEGDNFEEIMEAVTSGEEPLFGKNGELFFEVLDLMALNFEIPVNANMWRKNYEDMQNNINWKVNSREPENAAPETKEPETVSSEKKEKEEVNPDIKRYRGDLIKDVADEFLSGQDSNMRGIPAEVLHNAGLKDARPHSNAIVFDLFVMARHGVAFKDIPKFEKGELEGHDKAQYVQEFRKFLEEHPLSKTNEKGEKEYFPENAKAWGELYRDADKVISEYRIPEVDLGNPDTYAKAADEIAMLSKIGSDVVQVIQDHQMEKFRNPELNNGFVKGFGSMKNEMHFWANCSTLQNLQTFIGDCGVKMTNMQARVETGLMVTARWFATQNKDLYQGKTLQEYRQNVPFSFVPLITTPTGYKSIKSYNEIDAKALDDFMEKNTPLPSELAKKFENSIDFIKNDIQPEAVRGEIQGELKASAGPKVMEEYAGKLSVDGNALNIPGVPEMTPEQRHIAENCFDSTIFSAYNMYFTSCNVVDSGKDPFDLIHINGVKLNDHCKALYNGSRKSSNSSSWGSLTREEKEAFMKAETARAMVDPGDKVECYGLELNPDKTFSISKNAAVAGSLDEKLNKQRIEERIEKEKQAERDAYLKKHAGVLQDADNLYKPFLDVYGPKGTLPKGIGYNKTEDYDNITIDVPEGLDDITVAAIVIGAAMDAKYMNRAYSSSTSITGTMLENNRMHLVNNVVKGDGREKGFCPLMAEARQEAKEAIEAFKAGDQTKVKQMLQNFVDYGAANVNSASAGGGALSDIDTEKQAYKLAQDILDKNQFGIKPAPKGYTEINNIRLASYGKQMDALMRAEKAKIDLAENFDKMDKAQRDAAIADMMFDNLLTSMAKVNEKSRFDVESEYIKEGFRAYGIDTESESFESDYVGEKNTINASNQLHEYVQKFTVSDFDVILSKPDGVDRLKSLYMDEIKKSDTYKKLTSSKNKGVFTDELMNAENVFMKGITSIGNVKLPEESAEYNKEHRSKLQHVIKDVQKDVIKAAFGESDALIKEVDEYGLKTLDPENVKENAKKINKMYEELSALDSKKSPESFKELLKKLEAVRNITQKNAEKGSILNQIEAVSYMRSVEAFERQAEKYYDEAINNSRESERLESVNKIRRHLYAGSHPVSKAIDDMKIRVRNEVFGDTMKLNNDLNPTHYPYRSVFEGEKYASQKSRTGSPYTLDRSAGISVSIMALFNTGEYSFEDIMDPEKLQTEKRQMFDQVAIRMKNPTPENQEWIAKTIYEGQKQIERVLNEQAKKIDFENVDIATDKRFNQLMHLSAAQFDAWQEITHCKDEITKLALAEHPEMHGFEDYKKWWSDRSGPLGNIRESLGRVQEHAIDVATTVDELKSPVRSMVSEYVFMKRFMKATADAMLNNPDTPFTQCLSPDKVVEIRAGNGLIGEEIQKYAGAYIGKPEAAKALLNSITDGSFMLGKSFEIDFEKGKATLIGFETREDVEETEKILSADKMHGAERFEKLFDEAREATVGVYFGSKQYDTAMESIGKVRNAYKELQEIEKKRIELANNSEEGTVSAFEEIEERKQDKIDEIKKLMSEAEKDIEKYFDRKQRQGKMGDRADAKSRKRIGVLQDAMNAIDEYKAQINAEEMVNSAESMINARESLISQFDDTVYISMIEVRKAEFNEKALQSEGVERIIAKGAEKGLEVLKTIGSGSGDLTPKEVHSMKLCIATLVFAEMMNSKEGRSIIEKMPADMETYKEQVKNIADSKEFNDVVPEKMDRSAILFLASDEIETKRILKSFREKTRESVAAKKEAAAEKRKSVGPKQKPEAEAGGRKRSNTVTGRTVQVKL